jgi:hypothetical protein
MAVSSVLEGHGIRGAVAGSVDRKRVGAVGQAGVALSRRAHFTLEC